MNTVSLRLPVTASIFFAAGSGAGGWSHYQQNADLYIAEIELLKLFTNGKSVIRPDFDSLTPEQLHLYNPGAADDLDPFLDALLAAAGSKLKTADLKVNIADQIKKLLQNKADIEIPSPGSKFTAAQQWEFKVVPKSQGASGYDGLDLLLYESESKGKGLLSDAGNSIPDGKTPPYTFVLNLGKDALTQYFEETLDRQGYYSQGGSVNTPSNPYGYMIVSSKGQSLQYTLPAPPGGLPGSATLGPPVGGNVNVSIAKNSLNFHSRAYITNLDTGAKVEFGVNPDGSAAVGIAADAGQRLAITVYAVTHPNDLATVIWRPKLTLMDGKFHMSFYYYHYVEHWCNAEGDGWVETTFDVDRTSVFQLTPRKVAQKISLPWWVHIVGFLADLVTGGLANVIAGTILAEVLSTQLINNFLASKLDKKLKEEFQFPTPATERLALFLEGVELYATGITLTGYVDAGSIRHYGRQGVPVKSATNLFAGPGSDVVPIGLWPGPDSSLVVAAAWSSPSSPYGGLDASTKFWSGGYLEGKAATYGTGAVEVVPGQPLLLWVQHPESIAKFLIEWDAGTSTALVTWVCFNEHVVPAVDIDNHISAIVVDKFETPLFVWTAFRYEGWLGLNTTKFFRSPVTRDAGFEKWRWNGKEIPLGGTVSSRGLVIGWDTKSDRITIAIDQTAYRPFTFPLPPPNNPYTAVKQFVIVEQHLFEYEGQDAFGTRLSAQLSVYLPATMFGAPKIEYRAYVGPKIEIPKPDPWILQAWTPMVSEAVLAGSAAAFQGVSAAVERQLATGPAGEMPASAGSMSLARKAAADDTEAGRRPELIGAGKSGQP